MAKVDQIATDLFLFLKKGGKKGLVGWLSLSRSFDSECVSDKSHIKQGGKGLAVSEFAFSSRLVCGP